MTSLYKNIDGSALLDKASWVPAQKRVTGCQLGNFFEKLTYDLVHATSYFIN